MQPNTSQLPSLTLGSILLALVITAVWGFNFVMIKVGLNQIPPLTLCALRFLFASIPAIFFIARPKAPWVLIIGYGILVFALPFSLLFIGMAQGVTPGIAALILQLQVFFAILFAYLFAQQNLTLWQIIGALIAFAGIGIIALHRNGSCTGLGFMLVLGSAICWGLGSVLTIKLKSVNMLSLVVWCSFVAFIPLLGVALFLEQPLPILMHPFQLPATSILALAYITYASTLFGYGAWSWLLSTYPIASIVPFALLCPIIALGCSTVLLEESFELWKMASAALVIIGLGCNVFGPRIVERAKSRNNLTSSS